MVLSKSFFYVAFIGGLASCTTSNRSTIKGVRVGNSKLIVCGYPHALLGNKRVEQRALFHARQNKLTPLEAINPDAASVEKDYLDQILDTIKIKDPLYYGIIREFAWNFDAQDKKIVQYEFAGSVADAKSAEGPIVLPTDGFSAGDDKPFNPLYDQPRCRSEALVIRETSELATSKYIVIKNHWNVDLIREFLKPTQKDQPAMDPLLDFLDYKGRVAAKLEEAVDTLEPGSTVDNIEFVANLMSGAFAKMNLAEYAAWKEKRGLSTSYDLGFSNTWGYGHLKMASVKFFPAPNEGIVASGEIAEEGSTVFRAKELSLSNARIGTEEYALSFDYGDVEFFPTGTPKRIWGRLKFNHRKTPGSKCAIGFTEKESGTFEFDAKSIRSITMEGMSLYGCIDSKALPVKANSVQFNESGSVSSIKVKEDAEIYTNDGKLVSVKSGTEVKVRDHKMQ